MMLSDTSYTSEGVQPLTIAYKIYKSYERILKPIRRQFAIKRRRVRTAAGSSDVITLIFSGVSTRRVQQHHQLGKTSKSKMMLISFVVDISKPQYSILSSVVG